jgi:hypothetical protein
MQLPNAEQAIVDIAKLRDYCLSPTHPRGRHQARVFAATLGLRSDDAELLRRALLCAAMTEQAIVTERDAFGDRYVLDFRMQGPGGEAVVRSAWIVRTGEISPRLTSCYVLLP